MAAYELTQGADADLQEIAHHTITTWGGAQARRYEAALEEHFQGIARQRVKGRVFLAHRPELRVSRCQHHYVFHLIRDQECPLIVAVFHERMDLMTRLRKRLES
jgi:plasmid stabilization system protein ParE